MRLQDCEGAVSRYILVVKDIMNRCMGILFSLFMTKRKRVKEETYSRRVVFKKRTIVERYKQGSRKTCIETI